MRVGSYQQDIKLELQDESFTLYGSYSKMLMRPLVGLENDGLFTRTFLPA